MFSKDFVELNYLLVVLQVIMLILNGNPIGLHLQIFSIIIFSKDSSNTISKIAIKTND